MFNLIIDQQLIFINIKTKSVQSTIKLILIEKAIIIALLDSFDLTMILKKADLNEKKINIVIRK